MTLVEQLILDVLHKHTLLESEGKVDNFLSNQKNLDSMKQAIQSDPELTDKKADPKVLMLDWDSKSPITSKYIQWIGRQYINGQFYAGDIDQLAEDLRIFDKYAKGNKDIFPSADINTYTYSDLKPKVSQIDLEDTSRMGRNQQKAFSHAGKDEIEEVYDDNDFTIIIPKTKAAAIYWGSGSHWCTATKSEGNMFDHYNKMGPMYILISKKNPEEKYQFHFPTHQFMDKNDDPINVYEFTQSYPHVKAYFANTIKDIDRTNVENWAWIDNTLTYEDCEKALANHKNIAEGYTVLQLVPEKFKDYNLCETAVIHDGSNLQYVPKDLIDYNLYLQAVDTTPTVIQQVPDRFKDKELCVTALTDVWYIDGILKYIPDSIKKDKDFWIKCIQVNPTSSFFEKVPEEFRDYETYKQLVKSRTEDDPRLFVNLDEYKEEIIDRFKDLIPEETLMKIRDDLIKELKDSFSKKN